MKQLKISTLVLLLLLGIMESFGQTTEPKPIERKRMVLENIIATSTLLKIASNMENKVEARMVAHQSAINSYKIYTTNYEIIGTSLPEDARKQLDLVMNVYSQLCQQESFQYLLDGGSVTIIAMCAAKVEMVTELMIK